MSVPAEDIRAVALEKLLKIAPVTEAGAIDPTEDLRDELDIDSMDHLNLMIALHQRLGVEIPELNYPKLITLDYLSARGL